MTGGAIFRMTGGVIFRMTGGEYIDLNYIVSFNYCLRLSKFGMSGGEIYKIKKYNIVFIDICFTHFKT
mgnify:CR=1 FL=1